MWHLVVNSIHCNGDHKFLTINRTGWIQWMMSRDRFQVGWISGIGIWVSLDSCWLSYYKSKIIIDIWSNATSALLKITFFFFFFWRWWWSNSKTISSLKYFFFFCFHVGSLLRLLFLLLWFFKSLRPELSSFWSFF